MKPPSGHIALPWRQGANSNLISLIELAYRVRRALSGALSRKYLSLSNSSRSFSTTCIKDRKSSAEDNLFHWTVPSVQHCIQMSAATPTSSDAGSYSLCVSHVIRRRLWLPSSRSSIRHCSYTQYARCIDVLNAVCATWKGTALRRISRLCVARACVQMPHVGLAIVCMLNLVSPEIELLMVSSSNTIYPQALWCTCSQWTADNVRSCSSQSRDTAASFQAQ